MTFSLPKLIADTSTTAFRAVIQSGLVLGGVLGLQMVGVVIVAAMTVGEGRTWVEVLLVVLSVIALIAVEVACAYMCYMTTMNKIAAAGYNAARELISGITGAAAQKMNEKGIKNPKDYKSVSSVINVAEYIHTRYQEFPVLVRYAIEFMLSRVPAGAVVTQVINTELVGEGEAAIEGDETEDKAQTGKTSAAVESVLEEYVLTHDTFGWLLWFVPAAVAVQLVFIIIQWIT